MQSLKEERSMQVVIFINFDGCFSQQNISVEKSTVGTYDKNVKFCVDAF